MKFITNSEQVLLVFPVPEAWEIRIASNERYETVKISIDQAWQIVELIHDCESVREEKLKVEEDNHEHNMKEWTG